MKGPHEVQRIRGKVLLGLCLLAVLLAGIYWAWAVRLAGDGVPLDDAWIYFQFARMGARGHFGEFNEGEVVTGITGPLWAAVLVPLHAVAGENVALFLLLVKLIGTALLCLSVWAAVGLAGELFGDPRAGLAGGLFLLLMPKVIWGALSGMETPLLVLLVLVSLRLMLQQEKGGWRRDLLAPAVMGLAALTRPEAALLMVIFAGYQLLGWWKERAQGQFLRLLGRLAVQSLVFLLVLSPDLLFNYLATGRLLPNTFYAKTRGWNPLASLRFLGLGLGMVWLDPPPAARLSEILRWPPQSVSLGLETGYSLLKGVFLLGCFIWGIRRLPAKERALPALAWLIGDFSLYALFFTRTNRHYFVPMLPPVAVIAGGGLAALADALRLPKRHWQMMMLTTAIFLGIGAVDWAREYAWNVRDINDQQAAIGKWVAENLPADAVLAINDVGAIKYFSQRRIVDVTGLLTPELVLYIRAGRKMDYLREVAPDYLIVYEEWFPEARAWEGFEWVRDFRLQRTTIAGGSRVSVYRVRSFPPAANGGP